MEGGIDPEKSGAGTLPIRMVWAHDCGRGSGPSPLRDGPYTVRVRVTLQSLMIFISLGLNLAVLVPVCAGLFANAAWAVGAYGGPAPARSILLAVYLAIAAVSLLLLYRPDPRMVAALLLVQVVYKVATPFVVGTLKNPVVVSNIAISAVHVVTLAVIWRGTMRGA